MDFAIKAPFQPAGDQPQAIEKLAAGIEQGMRSQVLLGATGTGKTYTIAQVINKVSSQTTRWNILFPTMTTISRKRIFPRQIHT